MNLEILDTLLEKHRVHFFFYQHDKITQRLYEEKVRADMMSSSFVYFEISIRQLVRWENFNEHGSEVWAVFLTFIAAELRGSDVKGFNKKKDRLCFILLDCELPAIDLFLKRLEDEMRRKNLLKYLNPFSELLCESYLYTGKK